MEVEEGGRGNAHLASQRPLAHPLVDEPPPSGLNRLHQLNPPTLVQHGISQNVIAETPGHRG
jgi:hypothetical protein